MRYALAVLLLALGCAVDPVLLPDASPVDAGPCANACGPGTVCAGGACVPVDAGAADAPALDSGEAAADAPVAVDVVPVVDAPDVVALDVGDDAGVDAGAADVGSDAGAVDVPPPDAGRPDSGVDPRCDAAVPTFCVLGTDREGNRRDNFCTNLLTDNANCGGCAYDRCTGMTYCLRGVCARR